MSFFGRLIGRKDSAVGPLISMRGLGRPAWSGRNYKAFAKEGYIQNVVAHRCIRMVAEACSAMPILHFERDEELSESDLLTLLRNPNPWTSGAELIDHFMSYYRLSGNGYLEAVSLDGKVEELYTLRPDRMQVIPGRRGYPQGYKYSVSADQTFTYSQEVARGQVQPIMHMRDFHPTDDWYGLSPMEAAAYAIDSHNQSGAFNKALLDNSASPSGALVYSGGEDGNGSLDDGAFMRLKKELEERYSGAKNAGRPMLLEGGLTWTQMGLSPRDLEFTTGKREAAREVALAFGVPPMLLGIPGDNTFSNYTEANRAFYRGTAIPLMQRTLGAITRWLAPAFPNARLDVDLDKIEALSEERARKWDQVQKAQFLSTDEKREAVGYGKYEPSPEAGGSILVGAGQLPIEEAGFSPGGPAPKA